jgi:hypothetical protein
MQIQQNTEIGELIQEIIDSGWDKIQIEKLTETDFTVSAENVDLDMDEEYRMEGTGNLTESLSDIVETIREYIGKPSLSEELENLLEENRQHETLPPIFTGPEACCRCGSNSPLVGTRKIKIYQQWNGTFELEPGSDSLPDHGEILTCQDCGRNYSFSERQN